MKAAKILFFAGALLFKGANAAEETPQVTNAPTTAPSDPSQQQLDMNIHKSNKIISLGFSMAGTTRPGGSSSYNLGTSYTYFLVDHLAAGAALSLERDTVVSGSPYGMVGPRLIWFFWARNMLSCYFTFGVDKAVANSVLTGRVLGTFGIHSFITPVEAVGPFFTLKRVFANQGSNFTNFNAGANFGFYF